MGSTAPRCRAPSPRPAGGTLPLAHAFPSTTLRDQEDPVWRMTDLVRGTRTNGGALAQPTPLNVCMRSSSRVSKLMFRPRCRRQTLPRCCSGRCLLPVRSSCARLMAGKCWRKKTTQPLDVAVINNVIPPDRVTRIPTRFRTAPTAECHNTIRLILQLTSRTDPAVFLRAPGREAIGRASRSHLGDNA